MKQLALVAVLTSCVALASAQELPFLRPDKEYSGVRVVDTPRGPMRQKIFWTQDKARTETEVEGMQMTNIVRQDLGVMWIQSPMMPTCVEQPLDEMEPTIALEQAPELPDENVEYRKLGTESVAGHDTTKYEVVSTDPDGETHTALFWVNEDNITMRMEVSGSHPDQRFVMHLEELEVGPQPASLFESKGECMSMPAMPGMPGMPGAPPGER